LFNQDEVVIHQGEPGDSMFGLGEGLLSVFVSPQGNGEEIKVADMEPGSFFGEMSLLTGEPRSATVKAASASVIYEIRREDIKNIFVKRPEIVDSISHVIAQRKLDTNRALDEAATLSEREKAIDGAAAVLIKRVCTVFGIELGRERSP
jgi:CRP-like cAMP-binding protein